MALIRRVCRIIFLLAWTLIMVTASLPNRLRGWKGIKATCELTRVWAKGIAFISGINITTFGKSHNAGAGLVVSNHLGYIDIIVHASLFPLRFTPSTDVAKIPIVGGVTTASNAIFVNRRSTPAAKKAVRDFTKTMKRGIYLIVYPEGTSTDGKSGILPFKSTPFDAAAEGDMTILPILTRYREKTGSQRVAWYGDMTFFSHFWKLLGIRKIEAEVRFLDPIAPEGRDRKQLASFTHEMMSREWEKWGGIGSG